MFTNSNNSSKKCKRGVEEARYLNLLNPLLVRGKNSSHCRDVFDTDTVEQVLEPFMLLLKRILMILKLLLTPIVAGVGVERVDECIPFVFCEVLSVTVTVRYDGFTCGN